MDEWLVAAAEVLGIHVDSPAGVVVQDPSGAIVAATAAAEATLGLTRDQLLGRTSADPRWVAVNSRGEIMAPSTHPAMRVLLGQGPVVDFLMGVHRPTEDAAGEHIWLTVTSVPASPSSLIPAGSALTVFQPVEKARSHQLRLLDSERKYRLLAESSSDIVTWMAPDSTILWVSPAVKGVLGYEPDQLIGTRGFDLVHPGDIGQDQASLAALYLQGEPASVVLRERHTDGSWRWIESTGRAIRQHGKVTGFCTSRRDVTARILAEQQRDEAVAIFRLAMEHAPVGMAILRGDERIDRSNLALSHFTGKSADELLGQRLCDIISDNKAHLIAFTTQSHDAEFRFQRPDGTTVWGLCALVSLPSGNYQTRFLLQVQDVTSQHFEREQLSAAARTDALTGLPNRVAVADWLAGDPEDRGGHEIGVLFVDLDGFKKVNDTWGHKVGDQLLRLVSRRLTASVRKGDLVARLGGDEFVILCDDIDAPSLTKLAGRIRESIAEPVAVQGHTLMMTASVGAKAGKPEDAQLLLDRADHAMYRAKQSASLDLDL